MPVNSLPDSKIKIYQGANRPIVIWRFRANGALRPLWPFYRLVAIPPSSRPITVDTKVDPSELIMKPDLSEVWWSPCPDETARMRLGSGRYHLIGVKDGAVVPWAGGTMTVESYLNG